MSSIRYILVLIHPVHFGLNNLWRYLKEIYLVETGHSICCLFLIPQMIFTIFVFSSHMSPKFRASLIRRNFRGKVKDSGSFGFGHCSSIWILKHRNWSKGKQRKLSYAPDSAGKKCRKNIHSHLLFSSLHYKTGANRTIKFLYSHCNWCRWNKEI